MRLDHSTLYYTTNTSNGATKLAEETRRKLKEVFRKTTVPTRDKAENVFEQNTPGMELIINQLSKTLNQK